VKRSLISILLMLMLVIGNMPISVNAGEAGSKASQTGEYGTFVDGSQVIDDMIEKNGEAAHPRLIMTDARFADLRSHIGDGSVTASLLEELRGEANMYLGKDVSKITDYNGNFLETARKIQRYVATLSLAYNIFGEEKYAKRAYQELEAACGFSTWNPYHFLDPAELCTAFAYGYDWLYNWMNEEQRTLVRTNLINKGLKQVMEDYTGKYTNQKGSNGEYRSYYWYKSQMGDNWQFVCTGGASLAALAIGDEADAKTIAADVLTYSYKKAYTAVRQGYSSVDGTYIEGLGYWDYATYFLGLQSSALLSAAGSDYGLTDYIGIRKSAEFVCYMSSNYPKAFSFGDDRNDRETWWPVFLWLGELFDSKEMASIRLNHISDDKEFRYLDVLWADESKKTEAGSTNATDWGAVGTSNASFRTSWDKSGLVAALHVGENNYKYHGHFDLGSFYIESNGARFFTDLGNESYTLDNRKYSYRIKPEGHNTLVINPSKGTDQVDGANCLITEFASGNEAYAVTDLTGAYTANGANKVVRGLKMIKDKQCVIIQDEISLNQPGEIYWFAHTAGSISIAADGRSAIVTVGSDRLWVGLISEGGTFTKMKAEPLSTSLKVSGATSNSGYSKLAIHLTNTKNTTISVACIPLKSGQSKPSWTPTVKSLSSWSSNQPTATPVPTATATPTATPKPTATATPKPTATATPVPTATATPIPTATATPVPTATATPIPTATATPVPTATATPIPTATATPKPTATATPVPTATATPVPTATATPKPTATATPKPTATATPVPTATATPKPTATATPVPTAMPISTATPKPTAAATPVPTATATPVPTATATPVPTATATPKPTQGAGTIVIPITVPTATPTVAPTLSVVPSEGLQSEKDAEFTEALENGEIEEIETPLNSGSGQSGSSKQDELKLPILPAMKAITYLDKKLSAENINKTMAGFINSLLKGTAISELQKKKITAGEASRSTIKIMQVKDSSMSERGRRLLSEELGKRKASLLNRLWVEATFKTGDSAEKTIDLAKSPIRVSMSLDKYGLTESQKKKITVFRIYNGEVYPVESKFTEKGLEIKVNGKGVYCISTEK